RGAEARAGVVRAAAAGDTGSAQGDARSPAAGAEEGRTAGGRQRVVPGAAGEQEEVDGEAAAPAQSEVCPIQAQSQRTAWSSRAMQSMNTRIAKRINARMSRRGRVFDDRFFARSLRNPTEVANAIAYVLENSHRHDARRGWVATPTDEPDAFTSLALARFRSAL